MANEQAENKGWTMSLDERVAKLESNMSNLIASVERLSASIEKIGQRVSAGRSTNWGVLGTWSAVMVSVIGGLGILALMPVRNGIEELKMESHTHAAALQEHMKDGHPRRVEVKTEANAALTSNNARIIREHEMLHSHPAAAVALKALEEDHEANKKDISERYKATAERIREIDETLQREMRDLDNAVATEATARIVALDKQLQREFGLIADRLKDAETTNNKQIERILNWIDDHDKRVVGINAAQWERIRALERSEFGKVSEIPIGKPLGSELEN